MSEDGSNDSYIPDYDEPPIEIIIETLTGTTFEFVVSPTDTILSVKNRIQRVEGIPVSQQHLLYRMEELGNEARLCDHGIGSCSTLRLVLSMRGGPISTRRLASTEHHLAWREIKEYVDNTREDILDKLPPGSKVTVLLFREGEHLNLIRVIENEDGSCYPFSDSWLPVSKSKTKEPSQAKQVDRQAENNVLMRKVVELRRRMEGLSVQKKTRKPKTEDVCEESATSDVNGDCASNSSQFEQLSRIPAEFASGKSISDMYADRLLYIQQRKQSNIGRSHRPYRVDSSLVSPKSEELPLGGRNCSSLQAPSIAILEEEPESALNKKEDFSPASPISVPSGDVNTVAMSQIPNLPGTSRNLVHLAHMAHLVLDDHTDRPKSSPDKCEQKYLLGESERCHNRVKMGVTNRRPSIDYSRNLPRVQYNTSFNATSRDNEWSSFSPVYHRSSNLLTSQYASTSKLNNPHLDNLLGNRVSESTKYNETKRSPMYGSSQLDNLLGNKVTESTKYNEGKRSPVYGTSHLDNLLDNRVTEATKPNEGKRSPLYGSSHLDNLLERSLEFNKYDEERRPLYTSNSHSNNTSENKVTDSSKYNESRKSYGNSLGHSSSSTEHKVTDYSKYNERRSYGNSIDKLLESSSDNRRTLFGSSSHINNPLDTQTATNETRRSSFGSNTHFNNLLDNYLGDSTNTLYTEGRRSPFYGRRSRIERIKNPVDTGDKYGYSNLGYMEKTPNETKSPLYRHRSNLGSISNQNCDSKPVINSLPDILPKKSTRTRCALCNKRLNITTVHTCRCGGIFCAQHRYSEVHGCQYDYKTEGRKILEQTNPLVAAPKLPKI